MGFKPSQSTFKAWFFNRGKSSLAFHPKRKEGTDWLVDFIAQGQAHSDLLSPGN